MMLVITIVLDLLFLELSLRHSSMGEIKWDRKSIEDLKDINDGSVGNIVKSNEDKITEAVAKSLWDT